MGSGLELELNMYENRALLVGEVRGEDCVLGMRAGLTGPLDGALGEEGWERECREDWAEWKSSDEEFREGSMAGASMAGASRVGRGGEVGLEAG